MQDRNPYATPRANVTRGDDAVEEYGEVRLFAVSGRIGRVRYIAYSIALSLLVLLAAVILGVLAAVVDQNAALAVVGFAYLVVYAIQLLPGIQRAHDMNVSGWLSLISLIPLGALVFWLVPGTRGENTYGKPPPPIGAGVILVACLLPLTFFGGVLAAIAVPAYQDYTLRAQVSEGLSLAGGVKVAVAETFERTGAAPVDRLEAGLSADPMDTAGLYVDSVDVAKGTIVVTYGANANAAIAGSSLALRPYLMPDKRVAWRCGQGPVPEGAVAMDANATRFTTDMMPVHLPSACRP